MSYKSILASAAVLAAVVGTTGVVANADSTLPAATSTTKNDANGSVSGNSDATVKVEEGFLTLDAVPDMNFGLTAQSKTANKNLPLINNQGLISDDGNDSGLLKVTDSRTSTSGEEGSTTTTTMPWQLTATLGDFANVDGTAVANLSDWAINLKQTSGENTSGKMPSLFQVTRRNTVSCNQHKVRVTEARVFTTTRLTRHHWTWVLTYQPVNTMRLLHGH